MCVRGKKEEKKVDGDGEKEDEGRGKRKEGRGTTNKSLKRCAERQLERNQNELNRDFFFYYLWSTLYVHTCSVCIITRILWTKTCSTNLLQLLRTLERMTGVCDPQSAWSGEHAKLVRDPVCAFSPTGRTESSPLSLSHTLCVCICL